MNDQFLIFVGTLLSIFCAFAKERKTVLSLAGGAGLMFLLFWLVRGEMTAVYMGLAALFGTVLQYLTPEHKLKQTLYVRIGLCFILAILGFHISYNNPSDLLPLLAFSLGRASETFSKSLNIQIGYCFSCLTWLIFAMTIGDMGAIISNIVMLAIQCGCILHKIGVFSGRRFFTLQKRMYNRL